MMTASTATLVQRKKSPLSQDDRRPASAKSKRGKDTLAKASAPADSFAGRDVEGRITGARLFWNQFKALCRKNVLIRRVSWRCSA